MRIVVQTEGVNGAGYVRLHVRLVERVRLTTVRRGRLALRLALVLEPDRDGLYFPATWSVIDSDAYKCAVQQARRQKVKISTHIPPALATASRSSLDGWEFWWKRFSSIVSWTLVNRFLVRRVEFRTVTVLTFGCEACSDASSSEVEEKLKAELVLDRAPIGLGGFMVGTTKQKSKTGLRVFMRIPNPTN